LFEKKNKKKMTKRKTITEQIEEIDEKIVSLTNEKELLIKRKKLEPVETIFKKWVTKINKVEDNKDGKWTLIVFPHPLAKFNPLQCMHYLSMNSFEDYMGSYSVSQKKRYFSDIESDLKPDTIEDEKFLRGSGLQYLIVKTSEIENFKKYIERKKKEGCGCISKTYQNINALLTNEPHDCHIVFNIDKSTKSNKKFGDLFDRVKELKCYSMKQFEEK
jgi:hypothetical protein